MGEGPPVGAMATIDVLAEQRTVGVCLVWNTVTLTSPGPASACGVNAGGTGAVVTLTDAAPWLGSACPVQPACTAAIASMSRIRDHGSVRRIVRPLLSAPIRYPATSYDTGPAAPVPTRDALLVALAGRVAVAHLVGRRERPDQNLRLNSTPAADTSNEMPHREQWCPRSNQPGEASARRYERALLVA